QLSADIHEAAPRQGLPIRVHNLRDVTPGSSQVTVLHRAVNIHHPAYVVVRYNFHLSGSRYRSDIRQDLGTNHPRPAESCVLEILERLDLILRGLCDQAVLYAVLPVQEKCRRSLETAA